jgi:hypothetical protein
MAQIDIKNCTILIEDSAGHSLEVKIGEGNLTYSEKRSMLYTLNAGRLDEVREGDESPMDVKLDAVWEYISGGASSDGVPSVEDALKQRGAASGWSSTDSDTCRPYAVDLSIIYSPEPEGCGDEEDIVLADFRVEEYAHDLRAGTISISGKCNVIEAVATRVSPPVDDTTIMVTGFTGEIMPGLNGKYTKGVGLVNGHPYWSHWEQPDSRRIAWYTAPGKYCIAESADFEHDIEYQGINNSGNPTGTYVNMEDETGDGTAVYVDASQLIEIYMFTTAGRPCWVNQIDLTGTSTPGIVAGHQLPNTTGTFAFDSLGGSTRIYSLTGTGVGSVGQTPAFPPGAQYGVIDLILGAAISYRIEINMGTPT